MEPNKPKLNYAEFRQLVLKNTDGVLDSQVAREHAAVSAIVDLLKLPRKTRSEIYDHHKQSSGNDSLTFQTLQEVISCEFEFRLGNDAKSIERILNPSALFNQRIKSKLFEEFAEVEEQIPEGRPLCLILFYEKAPKQFLCMVDEHYAVDAPVSIKYTAADGSKIAIVSLEDLCKGIAKKDAS